MARRARPALAGLLAGALTALPATPDLAVPQDERPALYRRFAIEFVPDGESYRLLRDGVQVPDRVLADLPGEQDLAAMLRTRETWATFWRLGGGLVLLPLGAVVGVDNFFGKREEETRLGAITLPPSRVAPYEPGHAVTGLLLGAGVLMAGWGLGLLVTQAGIWAGWTTPRSLDPERAAEAAERQRLALLDRLNLTAPPPTPSPTPVPDPSARPPLPDSVLPGDFPEGTEGSAVWAIRQALASVGTGQWEPFLAWTDDMDDLESGTLARGSWQVMVRKRSLQPDPAVPYGLAPEVAAGLDSPTDDVREVSVPRHGGSVSWRSGALPYRVYRGGGEAFRRVRVDSPEALPRILAALRDMGRAAWWRPGTRVVLQPFRGRTAGPMWLLLPPSGEPALALDAERARLISLPGMSRPGTGPTAPGQAPGDPVGPAD
ncbi:MAG: hypothetical protein VKP57_04485 [Candidatus Sericytochromatia bacterium]|nr:hypothetical protein [Candidatus Sericytochromatia bacterium]